MSTSTTTTIFDLQSRKTIEADAEALRERFQRDGVLVFPRFFDDELTDVNAELARHFAPYKEAADKAVNQDANKHGCDVIPWNPVEDGNQTLIDLKNHAGMNVLTEVVLGAGFSAPSSLVMFSVGGGQGQAWHQDCPAGEDKGFNLNRLIYTEDVSREDGAIVFVPGSHKAGRIPPGDHQEPMPGEIMLEPEAGTLVFLHGHVFHRVTPNLNLNPRNSINFRAYPAGVDPDVNCIGVYRNDEVNFCDKPKHHDGKPAAMAAMTGR